jgi:hypothetical protein
VFPRQVAPSTVVVGKRIVRRAEVCRGDRHRNSRFAERGVCPFAVTRDFVALPA